MQTDFMFPLSVLCCYGISCQYHISYPTTLTNLCIHRPRGWTSTFSQFLPLSISHIEHLTHFLVYLTYLTDDSQVLRSNCSSSAQLSIRFASYKCAIKKAKVKLPSCIGIVSLQEYNVKILDNGVAVDT